jgi:hypothetical protein
MRGVEGMGMPRVFAGMLLMASVTFVTEAIGQMQTPLPTEQRSAGKQQPMPGQVKRVQGEVRSIDPSGTEITLTDGTTLLTPPGATLRPGLLTAGATVIASYTEVDGQKVMTDLAVVNEPSASPRTRPGPPGPSTAPPSDLPKR